MADTTTDVAVLTNMVGTTGSVRDRKATALALRLARQLGVYDQVRDAALAKRADWRTWLTLTQARWGRETRRPARARHHDSIAIRERYVRTTNG